MTNNKRGTSDKANILAEGAAPSPKACAQLQEATVSKYSELNGNIEEYDNSIASLGGSVACLAAIDVGSHF